MFNPMMYLNFMGGGRGQQQQGGGLWNNPMFQAMGLGFGGDLLGGIGGLLQGESEQEKRSKQMYQRGLAEMNSNRDILNPMQTATQSYAATLPMINKRAGQIGARLNLDSGQAQGAMTEQLYPEFMRQYADANLQNQLGKENRRRSMFQTMMGQYGGY